MNLNFGVLTKFDKVSADWSPSFYCACAETSTYKHPVELTTTLQRLILRPQFLPRDARSASAVLLSCVSRKIISERIDSFTKLPCHSMLKLKMRSAQPVQVACNIIVVGRQVDKGERRR